MKGKKVYISGPMSGKEDFNYPAFFSAEESLKKDGAIVINPARHPIGLEYNQYMAYARLDVLHSDIVVCLDGWKGSKGAKQEVLWANRYNKKVIEFGKNCKESNNG